jgi:hypothetical protein
MRTAKHQLYIVSAILLAAVIVLVFHWLFTGHKSFELTQQCDHYSFEYPASYRAQCSRPDASSVHISGWASLGGWMSNRGKVTMGIHVRESFSDAQDAHAMADHVLLLETRELQERSSETIAGIPCETVTYHSYPNVCRVALFKYNSRYWELFVCCRPEYAQQAQAIFEHAFNTFAVKSVMETREMSILSLSLTPGSVESSEYLEEVQAAIAVSEHHLIEGASDAFPEWAGAELSAPVALYDLEGRLICFLFAIKKDGETVDTMTVGSSLYFNDLFDQLSGGLPMLPLASDVARIAEKDLDIRGTASDKPERLLYLGRYDVYAVYEVHGQEVGVNLRSRRGALVSNLQMRISTPEQYARDREQRATEGVTGP